MARLLCHSLKSVAWMIVAIPLEEVRLPALNVRCRRWRGLKVLRDTVFEFDRQGRH